MLSKESHFVSTLKKLNMKIKWTIKKDIYVTNKPKYAYVTFQILKSHIITDNLKVGNRIKLR